MKRRAMFLLLTLILVACGGADEPDPDARATEIAAVVETILTAEAVPPPTAVPSPTTGPTARDVYRERAPSVAYVETPLTQGSGLLIEGGYVVTNAHVVWPYESVRVVFPDGSEFSDTPVIGWDQLTDLAILGPLEVDLSPLALVDGEALEVGEEVYLIGYPGEEERFPQPALTRGILSRVREWEGPGLTYFQADALIAGGQSGGVLVDATGQVIGISGFSFTESAFGLVASAADLIPRIDGLIAGEDVSGLADRTLPLDGEGVTRDTFSLDSFWDHRTYLLVVDEQTPVEIEVEGANDVAVTIYDIFGEVVAEADEEVTGLEFVSATARPDDPLIVYIEQFDDLAGDFILTSSVPLVWFGDQDDANPVTIGEPRLGSTDYPGDLDFYFVDLAAGQTVTIEVDSAAIDPLLGIELQGAGEETYTSDDDGGGGLFGLNAELTYTAPESGTYVLIVSDAANEDVGGYIIEVREGDS